MRTPFPRLARAVRQRRPLLATVAPAPVPAPAARVSRTSARSSRRPGRGPLLRLLGGLALVAYVPLLLTQRGWVSADTKTYLYLDPSKLMSRAWSMWDPSIGLGTVTHQNVGYLWPMGPFYWALDKIGVPDWAAQRIWWGTIIFAAGAGVVYLLRTLGWGDSPGVTSATFVYALDALPAHPRGPAVGDPPPVRGPAVARRAHDPHRPHQGMAVPRPLRPDRGDVRKRQRHRACCSSGWPRRCGWPTPCGWPARSRCGPPSGPRCGSAR